MEDPLHPLGRCTCGGEGRCEWCQRRCPDCGEFTIYHGDRCLENAVSLRARIKTLHQALRDVGYPGRAEVRVGPREQWDEYPPRGRQWPEPEADYEALGYPETQLGPSTLEFVGALLATGYSEALSRVLPITNNQTTSITVDDGASD